MNNNSYLVIQRWMIDDLHLSGINLMIYAIIYGFSQDEMSEFSGSRQYLADWCNCSIRSVQTALNSLCADGKITKKENIVNGVKFCSYVANFTSSEKISPPSEKISHNNIAYSNTIDNKEIDNIELSNDNSNDFEGHAYTDNKVTKNKTKKKSLYDKCRDAITEFTDLPEIEKPLLDYLSFRLSVKDKPIYNVNQWKALLKKLDACVEECRKPYEDIIQQSIDKCWLSFYPINSRRRDVFSEYGEVNCNKGDDSVDEEF